MGVHDESARRVSDCVAHLLTEQPFFGSLALRLPIRPDPTRETLASDGHELRYAPAWVARTNGDRIKTAVARVVLACALKHHTRRGGRDPERWQRASQLVTHGELRRAGFVLPAEAEAWEDVSVEDAYERLAGEESGESGRQGAPGPTDDGAGDSDSAGSGDEGTAGDEASGAGDRRDSGGPSGPSGAASGSGGSGSSGAPDSEASPHGQDRTAGNGDSPAPPSHDPAGTGEVMDAAARGEKDGAASPGDAIPLDLAAEEQAWDEALHQAVRLATAQGHRPGRIEETLRDAHRSRLDWRTLLRHYLVSAARDDYRWSVPNRRFIDAGLYLPSMHSEGLGALAVLIDTSGSLAPATLATFWAEVRAVAGELRPDTLAVVQVDTEVQDAAVYRFGDLPETLTAKGRGGTDFRPGFAWLAQEGIVPDCCLYLTDMDCDRYPETPPPYPVLWCSWGPAPPARDAPWGERIDVAA